MPFLSIETPPIHPSSVSPHFRALRERSPSPPRDNDDIHGVAAQVGDTVRRMMPLSAPKVTFESAHRAHHYTEEEWKKITVCALSCVGPRAGGELEEAPSKHETGA